MGIPGETVDYLICGELKSGEHFFGFVANDASPYIITRELQDDIQFLNCPGQEQGQSRWKLNGIALDSVLLDSDWLPVEGAGGYTFEVTTRDFQDLAALIRPCAGTTLPLLYFTAD